MGFRINTNVAAMNAQRNSTMTNQGLNKSLNSLSSGLRINKASDDASGMTIADSLRSQAQGLGQAINNANDGVAIVQTADGALDEYINIINTVRTKSIQAASDGQNKDSRAAIQADIDRLLEAADSIANTTQFNGQKLLDGSFTNKAFQIGAYAAETVNLSVDSVLTTEVGSVKSAVDNSTISSALEASTSANLQKNADNTYAYKDDFLKIDGKEISPTLSKNNQFAVLDAKNIAAAITDATGIIATAETKASGASAVSAGTISATATNYLKINGIDIGAVTMTASDGTGTLASAINAISEQTGVTAKVGTTGLIALTAADGRNISLDAVGTGSSLTNLTDSTTAVAGTANSAFSGASVAATTLAAGDLVINGVDMKGTYGDGVTAGQAGKDLAIAIKAIAGLDQSSVGTTGVISAKSNTGIDVNVSANNTALYSTAQAGLQNASNKGNITMYSDTLIKVEATAADKLGFQTGTITTGKGSERLNSIDVTSRESAQLGILISDSSLKALDATRADLGSVQNQLESTIRNISVTRVNVTAAESQIRDVDFALESANFAKLNILAQSGSYAMSQANAVQQNVMRLLQ